MNKEDRQTPVRLTITTAHDLITWMKENNAAGKFNGMTFKQVAALAVRDMPSMPRGLSESSISGIARHYELNWDRPNAKVPRVDLLAKIEALEARIDEMAEDYEKRLSWMSDVTNGLVDRVNVVKERIEKLESWALTVKEVEDVE